MSVTTSQMLNGVREIIKDRIREFFGIREEKDPSKLTEAERWVQSEIAYHKRNRCILAGYGFGIHYPEWYLRSCPAEEIYAKWQKDVEDIEQYIDDLVEQSEEKDAAEKKAEEKRAEEKRTREKGFKRKKRKEKRMADIIEFKRKTE